MIRCSRRAAPTPVAPLRSANRVSRQIRPRRGTSPSRIHARADADRAPRNAGTSRSAVPRLGAGCGARLAALAVPGTGTRSSSRRDDRRLHGRVTHLIAGRCRMQAFPRRPTTSPAHTPASSRPTLRMRARRTAHANRPASNSRRRGPRPAGRPTSVSAACSPDAPSQTARRDRRRRRPFASGGPFHSFYK